MEWAVVALALLLAGLVVARARAASADAATLLVPADLADIEARLEAIARQERNAAAALVTSRLEVARRRRVPVRAVRPAPAPHTVRICFADGTVVLAHGLHPGSLTGLAVLVRQHSVCLEQWHAEAGGFRLVFTWAPNGRAEAIALGLDQAD